MVLARFVAVLLATTLLAATPAAPQEAEPVADLRVAREDLSKQAEAPFLFAGQVMNDTRPRWGEYARALAEHPDTLSCLTLEARDDPAPDLAASYDWAGIEGFAATNVCLFRIGVSLGTPERVEAWMAVQGMWLGPEDRPDWRSSREPVVGGTWRLAEVCDRSRILGPVRCFLLRPIDPFYVFVVSFDEEGRVEGASVNGKAW